MQRRKLAPWRPPAMGAALAMKKAWSSVTPTLDAPTPEGSVAQVAVDPARKENVPQQYAELPPQGPTDGPEKKKSLVQLNEQYETMQGQVQARRGEHESGKSQGGNSDKVTQFIDALKLARDEAVQQRLVTGDKLRRFRVQTGDLQDDKRSLEDQLRLANQQIHRLQDQLEDRLTSLEKGAEQYRVDTREAMGTLRSENQQLRDANKSLQDQLHNATQKPETAGELGETNDEIKELRREKAILEEKLRAAHDKFQEAKGNSAADLDASKREIIQLKASNQEAWGQSQVAEGAVKHMKAQNQDLRAANELAQEQMREMQRRLHSLEANRDLQQQQLEKVRGEAASLESENIRLIEDKTLLQKQLKEERKAVEQLRPLNKSLQKELEALKAERSSSTNLAETTDKQLQAAQKLIGILEAKLKVAQIFAAKNPKPKSECDATLQVSRALPLETLPPENDKQSKSMEEELLQQLAGAKTVSARTQGEIQTLLDHNLLELRAAHAAMQEELREASGEIQALEAGLVELADLRQELEELKSANRKATNAKRAIEIELELSRNKANVATKKASDLLEESQTLRAKVEEAERERDRIQEILDQKSIDLQTATNSLAALEAQIATSNSEHTSKEKDLVDRLAESQKEKHKLEGVIDSYQTMISQLETETGEIIDHQRKIQAEVQALKAERSSLQETLEGKGAELNEIKDALKKSEDFVERHAGTVKQLNRALARSDEEKGQLVKEIDELKAGAARDVQALNSECGDLRNQGTVMKAELDEARYEAKQLQALNNRQHKRVSSLEEEVADCRNENEELENKQRKNAKAMAALQLERDDLEASLQLVKAELRGKAESLELVDALKDGERKKIAELEFQVTRLESQRADAARQLETSKSEFAQQKALLDATFHDLERAKAAKSALEATLMQEFFELRTCPSLTERDVQRAVGSLKSELAFREEKNRETSQAKEKAKKDLADAQDRVNSLTRRNEDLSKRREEGFLELEKIRLELLPTRKENDQLRKQIADLESRQSEQHRSRSLSDHIDEPKTAMLARQLDQRDQELLSLQRKYEDLSRTHQGLVRASRDAAVALSNQLEDRNHEFENLQKKFRTINSEHLLAKERLRKLEDDKDENDKSSRRMHKKLDEAKAEIKVLQQQREAILLELEEACASRDLAQKALKVQEASIETLRTNQKTESDVNKEKVERLSNDLLLAENSLSESERQLEEVKSKLREMALEKRNLTSECMEDKNRISQLLAQLEGSRQAYSEVTASKDIIDAKLKDAESGITELMEALAIVENEYNARNSESQVAYKTLMSRAEKLESQLPSLMLEKQKLENEVQHIRGKLRKTMSTNSMVQAACDKAKSDLDAITREMNKMVRPGSAQGLDDLRKEDPIEVVAKVKASLLDAIDGREEAAKSLELLQKALRKTMSTNSTVQAACDKAKSDLNAITREMNKMVRPGSAQALNDLREEDPIEVVAKVKALLLDAIDRREEAAKSLELLQKAFKEKQQDFAHLQMTSAEEKENLEKRLISLEATVKEVSGDNRQLLFRINSRQKDAEGQGARHAKLNDAEGQADRLSGELAAAKKANEVILVENVSLQEKLVEALDSLCMLKEKAKKEAATLRTELQESLDKGVAIATEMKKPEPRPGDRTFALELTLADRDKRLKQVLGEMQEKDAERETLRKEAIKLKWFVEEFLDEAKKLVVILTDAVADPELDRLHDSLSSSTKSVLEKLATIVKHFETEFNEDRNEYINDAFPSREPEGDESRMSPTGSEHDDSSAKQSVESSVCSAVSLSSEIGLRSRRSIKTFPGAIKSPLSFRLNLPQPSYHGTVSPRYLPTKPIISLDNPASTILPKKRTDGRSKLQLTTNYDRIPDAKKHRSSSEQALQRDLDQAAYVQRRLEESIALGPLRVQSKKTLRTVHPGFHNANANAKKRDPQPSSHLSDAKGSYGIVDDESRKEKGFIDPPTNRSVDAL